MCEVVICLSSISPLQSTSGSHNASPLALSLFSIQRALLDVPQPVARFPQRNGRVPIGVRLAQVPQACAEDCDDARRCPLRPTELSIAASKLGLSGHCRPELPPDRRENACSYTVGCTNPRLQRPRIRNWLRGKKAQVGERTEPQRNGRISQTFPRQMAC